MLRAWQRAEGLAGYPQRQGTCCWGTCCWGALPFGRLAFRRHARPAWVLMLTFLRAHYARLVDVV